jgi:hypothetical protein
VARWVLSGRRTFIITDAGDGGVRVKHGPVETIAVVVIHRTEPDSVHCGHVLAAAIRAGFVDIEWSAEEAVHGG